MPIDFTFENTRPMMSDDDILADLRRVAAELQTPNLTIRSYNAHGSYSQATVKKRFGTWNSAITKAGLETASVRDIPLEELFDNLREVWIHLGRQPRKRDMELPISRFTREPYLRHFGGWLAAIKGFLASLEDRGSSLHTSSQPAVGAVARGPREPSLRLRFLVMRRDRFMCRYCGRSPAAHPGLILHVDHVVAWASGGRTTLENLQTLCDRCNLGKSTLPSGAV
jgi:hypothetical protein